MSAAGLMLLCERGWWGAGRGRAEMGKVLEDRTDCAPLHTHVSFSSRNQGKRVSLQKRAIFKMCQGIDVEAARRADTKQTRTD